MSFLMRRLIVKYLSTFMWNCLIPMQVHNYLTCPRVFDQPEQSVWATGFTDSSKVKHGMRCGLPLCPAWHTTCPVGKVKEVVRSSCLHFPIKRDQLHIKRECIDMCFDVRSSSVLILGKEYGHIHRRVYLTRLYCTRKYQNLLIIETDYTYMVVFLLFHQIGRHQRLKVNCSLSHRIMRTHNLYSQALTTRFGALVSLKHAPLVLHRYMHLTSIHETLIINVNTVCPQGTNDQQLSSYWAV